MWNVHMRMRILNYERKVPDENSRLRGQDFDDSNKILQYISYDILLG